MRIALTLALLALCAGTPAQTRCTHDSAGMFRCVEEGRLSVAPTEGYRTWTPSPVQPPAKPQAPAAVPEKPSTSSTAGPISSGANVKAPGMSKLCTYDAARGVTCE